MCAREKSAEQKMATFYRLALMTLAIVNFAGVSGKTFKIRGLDGWSYSPGDPVGPENWHKYYKACQGKRQSPINIETSSARYSKKLSPLNFSYYGEKKNLGTMTAANDGYNALVDLNNDKPYVQGGGLPDKVIAFQFHFHWGSNNSVGSEHTVDGKRFPLEMNILCLRASEDDVYAAVQKKLGIVSMVVLFEIGSDRNTKYDRVFKQFNEIKYKGDEKTFSAFPLTDLLPTNPEKFWKYDGSMALPPCLETITLFVFQDTIKISEAQLAVLRQLSQHTRKYSREHSEEVFKPVSDNGRALQDRAGRTVLTSWKSSTV